jgi:hypothetical protein
MTGRVFIYRHLWQVVEKQFSHSEERFSNDLVAIVFAFHTLEAYLNTVGEILAPDIWGKEREFFKKDPYRGFYGKLKKILELVRISENEISRLSPTVKWLKEFRDQISHGKVWDYSFEENQNKDMFWSPLHGMVTHQRATKIRDDVVALIELIHSKANRKKGKPFFDSKALENVMQVVSNF